MRAGTVATQGGHVLILSWGHALFPPSDQAGRCWELHIRVRRLLPPTEHLPAPLGDRRLKTAPKQMPSSEHVLDGRELEPACFWLLLLHPAECVCACVCFGEHSSGSRNPHSLADRRLALIAPRSVPSRGKIQGIQQSKNSSSLRRLRRPGWMIPLLPCPARSDSSSNSTLGSEPHAPPGSYKTGQDRTWLHGLIAKISSKNSNRTLTLTRSPPAVRIVLSLIHI